MKKLTLLTAAAVIAVCGSANAVNSPSLGDRIKGNWDSRADRNMWADPYVAPSEVAPASDVKKDRKGKKHAKAAAHKEKMAKLSPEERAKKKAERKAKWDAMTPEQKAAWKARHAKRAALTNSNLAPAANTTSAPATTAPAAQ